jgi:glycosyltransferase involved in cell wall biosynthesis
MRILHVIHDFLPRHLAGSEIYAFRLCRELGRKHQVYVLCAEYDGGRRHGSISWRLYEDLPIIEVINNWSFSAFADSYQSRRLNGQLDRVLRAVRPDVLHIHNLLNLSMDLPALAKNCGIPSVATLHDYTLVCPSGGQRVHLAEEHMCDVIDVQRCSRCFAESPFYRQMAIHKPLTRILSLTQIDSVAPEPVRRLLATVNKATATRLRPSAADISRRLEKVKEVFASVELFVAPSPSLGAEYVRLGLPPHKVHVSDYGFVPLRSGTSIPRRSPTKPLRIGFVGTLVWHKGVHVLLEAVKQLPPEDFELRLFGDPEVFPTYVASLRERAEGSPVQFMGRFDVAGSANAYAQIDVLVVPSLWLENSPLVIHEAFMAGIPVVGARRGGIPDLVTDGVNGLLYDAFSADALAASLKRLIDDPDYVRLLGSQVPPIKRVQEDAREWETVYSNVLERFHPSAAAS